MSITKERLNRKKITRENRKGKDRIMYIKIFRKDVTKGEENRGRKKRGKKMKRKRQTYNK